MATNLSHDLAIGPDDRDTARSGQQDYPVRAGHLAAILGIGVVLAAGLELLGRFLYHQFAAPYAITGTLTLLAICASAGVSVYVMRRLRIAPWILRAVFTGSLFLILSQLFSLITTYDAFLPARILARLDPTGIVFEESFFVGGFALPFMGFYLSLFEVHQSNL